MLLLGNVVRRFLTVPYVSHRWSQIVNESLPIFLDSAVRISLLFLQADNILKYRLLQLGGGLAAVIISTTMIGE